MEPSRNLPHPSTFPEVLGLIPCCNKKSGEQTGQKHAKTLVWALMSKIHETKIEPSKLSKLLNHTSSNLSHRLLQADQASYFWERRCYRTNRQIWHHDHCDYSKTLTQDRVGIDSADLSRRSYTSVYLMLLLQACAQFLDVLSIQCSYKTRMIRYWKAHSRKLKDAARVGCPGTKFQEKSSVKVSSNRTLQMHGYNLIHSNLAGFHNPCCMANWPILIARAQPWRPQESSDT